MWHHRCALRRLLALLEQQIGWEEEEMGLDGDGEGEYVEVRRAVKVRLGHLLHSTLVLLEVAEDSQGSDHLGPDHDCTQVELRTGERVNVEGRANFIFISIF